MFYICLIFTITLKCHNSLFFSDEENEAQEINWKGIGKFGEVTEMKKDSSKVLHA